MKYEATPIKNNTKAASKAVLVQAAQRLSTWRLLTIIVCRHKVGLLITSNAVFMLSFAVPAWPHMLLDIFR